jgi:hypothetical protein
MRTEKQRRHSTAAAYGQTRVWKNVKEWTAQAGSATR